MSANILLTGPHTRLCIKSTLRDCVCHTDIRKFKRMNGTFQIRINNGEKGRNGWTCVLVTCRPTCVGGIIKFRITVPPHPQWERQSYCVIQRQCCTHRNPVNKGIWGFNGDTFCIKMLLQALLYTGWKVKTNIMCPVLHILTSMSKTFSTKVQLTDRLINSLRATQNFCSFGIGTVSSPLAGWLSSTGLVTCKSWVDISVRPC